MKTPSCLDGINFTKNNTIVLAFGGFIYVKKRNPDDASRFIVSRQRYDEATDEWVDFDPARMTTADRRIVVRSAQKDNIPIGDVARLMGVTVSTIASDLAK